MFTNPDEDAINISKVGVIYIVGKSRIGEVVEGRVYKASSNYWLGVSYGVGEEEEREVESVCGL